MKKSWYSIKNKTASQPAKISIHEDIGIWGIGAKEFIQDLVALGEVADIEMSVNSPGGNVFDALAIYNTLSRHPAKITAIVEGIAASAASFIIMAADAIMMPEDSFIMIHNAMGGTFGKSEDLRDMADLMDKITSQIANIYQRKTGRKDAEIMAMMDKETWMNAAEAVDLGFADEVINKIGVAAKAGCFERYFRQFPVASANEPPPVEQIRDLERVLRDAGHSKNQAMAIIANIKANILRDADKDAETNQLNAISARLAQIAIPHSIV